MKEDIQLTKIEKSYGEIWEKIVVLLDECIDKDGELFAANVVRRLSIEVGARNIFAAAIVSQEDLQDVMEAFIHSVHERFEQLIENAVKLGLLKESDK